MDCFRSSNENIYCIHDAFPRVLQDCIERLAQDRKLIVISDFDHTFTTFDSLTCHDLIGEHDSYTDRFRTLYKSTFIKADDFSQISMLWRTSHDMYIYTIYNNLVHINLLIKSTTSNLIQFLIYIELYHTVD